MLPYLEQSPLYNAANFSFGTVLGIGFQVNSTVFNSNLSVFLCPSDGIAATSASYASSNNNYFGCTGTTMRPGNLNTTGVFTCSSKVCYGMQTMTDGTSNTIAFSEGVVGDTTHFTPYRDGVSWTASPPNTRPIAATITSATMPGAASPSS